MGYLMGYSLEDLYREPTSLSQQYYLFHTVASCGRDCASQKAKLSSLTCGTCIEPNLQARIFY